MNWKLVELGLPVTEHTAPGVIIEPQTHQKLRIPNVKRHHAGTYQCNITSKVGRDSRQFNLNVIGKSASLVYFIVSTFQKHKLNYVSATKSV